MGTLTLLQHIQTACNEIGLIAPSSVIGNSNQQITQLLALSRREGKMQYQRGVPLNGWPQMRTEYVFNVQSTGLTPCSITANSNVITFLSPPAVSPQIGWVVSNSGSSNASGFTYPTTVTSIAGLPNSVTVSNVSSVTNTKTTIAIGQDTYPMPSDIDHTIPQTFWDRSFRWQLLGPINPQEWQVLKSGISPTGPRRRFRIFGGNFVVDPVPYDNNQLVYEYYSKNWCQSAGGTTQAEWAADSDTFRLDDDAMTLGIIWRYRRAKGLDYTEERDMYEERMSVVVSRVASSRALPLNAQAGGIRLLNSQNTPDTGFGS